MSAPTVAEVIAELYESHDEGCDCGRPESHTEGALLDAGYAVVKLPEVMPVRSTYTDKIGEQVPSATLRDIAVGMLLQADKQDVEDRS